MTNRPTHTAIVRYDPDDRVDDVLVIDLATGHAIDQLVVDDAEWIANGPEHLARRGFAADWFGRGAGHRAWTWPLVSTR